MTNFDNHLLRSIIKKITHPKDQQYPKQLLQKRNPSSAKWVLFSYLPYTLELKDDSPNFLGHSNAWCSREIGRIFYELGYNIDAISWNDFSFTPERQYDAVFDICYNLGRLSGFFSSSTIKLLHCTGSDPYYQNSAELDRVKAVNLRRNGQYSPKRLVGNPALATKSINAADFILLLGNKYTLSTYSTLIKDKFTLISVTGSELGRVKKGKGQFVPHQREFLWFFGTGAVHKGLDLVLEVFKDHPEYHLNIVGPVSKETDFVSLYYEELFSKPNIQFYGFLLPQSKQFKDIINRSFCFIAPTCSEGTSAAVVTCMQLGLLPIISIDAGVDLPTHSGVLLEECTYESILNAVDKTFRMDTDTLDQQISDTQFYASITYSKEEFRNQMFTYLRKALDS